MKRDKLTKKVSLMFKESDMEKTFNRGYLHGVSVLATELLNKTQTAMHVEDLQILITQTRDELIDLLKD